MRGKRAFKRSRAVPILVAGVVGYALGGWSASMPRTTALTAAQAVALRFPQDWDDAAAIVSAASATTSAITVASTQTPLLSPEPMVASTVISKTSAARATSASQAYVPEASPPQAVVQTASLGGTRQASAPAQPTLRPTMQASLAKPAAGSVRHRVERPSFVLNDAQIASIKDRLHLTPDQEQMWPAVEAALRNIAYNRARHGAPATAAQVASADPNSVEVQGLKSAAIPLLMSFNSEQKDEVRSLAHVMGLDQLATQF
jgi:hypothetical protein